MDRIDIDDDLLEFEEEEEEEEENKKEEEKEQQPQDKNFPFSIPIPTQEELPSITLKRTANLLHNCLDKEGWDLSTTGEDKGVKVSFKYMQNSPIVYMKAQSPVINCSANTLLNYIYSPESTKEMDEMFIGETMLRQYDSNNIIYYAQYSAPWPVWPRDFTFLWTKRWTKEGYGICCAVSVLYPGYAEGEGECKGYVRGELVETGMVVKDVGDPEDRQCHLTYIVCVNPRGWIPTMVVNTIAGNQAMNCIRLKEHFDKVGDENPQAPPLPK